MATDIMGLLTGVSKQGIDPMTTLTPAQQRMEFGARRAKGLGGAVRGMLGGGPTAQEQIATRMVEKQLQEKAKREEQLNRLADALPPEYSALANAIRNNVEGALKQGLEILSREKKQPTPKELKLVNLVDTATNRTVGMAVQKDGKLYRQGSNVPMSPEELSKFGISTSYVKPPQPLVSTAVDPEEKAAAERRSALFTPLKTIAESTATKAETANAEKRTALSGLRAVDTNATTGVISAVGSDLAQIGQDFFQTLGMPVPESFSKATSSKAQYKILSAQGLLPRIAEQGKGFTDPEREYFLNEVIPSYKQAWQFNELAYNLQLEDSLLKIAEAGFADSRNVWHVENNQTPKQTHAVIWDDYTTKLPYSKLKKNAKRTVGDKEVTYDKYQTLTDDGNLWQYWATGKEPTGFTLKNNDGTTTDYTFKELNNLFEGYSAREVLQRADVTGNLVGATY